MVRGPPRRQGDKTLVRPLVAFSNGWGVVIKLTCTAHGELVASAIHKAKTLNQILRFFTNPAKGLAEQEQHIRLEPDMRIGLVAGLIIESIKLGDIDFRVSSPEGNVVDEICR
jgi:hypothetical protein